MLNNLLKRTLTLKRTPDPTKGSEAQIALVDKKDRNASFEDRYGLIIDPTVPKCPPRIQLYDLISTDRVLGSQVDLLKRIQRNLGCPTLMFDEQVMPAIRRYAEFVHLLPASQQHHHSARGGLFRHGLEVGFIASQIAQSDIFNTGESKEEQRNNETVWHFAAFLTGMCHDVGKPISDMRVLDESGKHRWNPESETLLEWAEENNITQYHIEWIEGRGRNHIQLTPFALQNVINKPLRSFLTEHCSEIYQAVLLGVTGAATEGRLGALVNKADQQSVEKDLRERSISISEASYSLPVEKYVLDAMRRLISSGRWKVNQAGSVVWYLKPGGLFINWSRGAKDILELVEKDKIPAIPKDEKTLADIMIDRALALPRPYEGEDVGSGRYYRFWKCSVEVETEGMKGSNTFNGLRFEVPEHLLTDGLPEPMEAKVEGLNPVKVENVICDPVTGEVLDVAYPQEGEVVEIKKEDVPFIGRNPSNEIPTLDTSAPKQIDKAGQEDSTKPSTIPPTLATPNPLNDALNSLHPFGNTEQSNKQSNRDDNPAPLLQQPIVPEEIAPLEKDPFFNKPINVPVNKTPVANKPKKLKAKNKKKPYEKKERQEINAPLDMPLLKAGNTDTVVATTKVKTPALPCFNNASKQPGIPAFHTDQKEKPDTKFDVNETESKTITLVKDANKAFAAVEKLLDSKGEAGAILKRAIVGVRDGDQLGDVLSAFGGKLMMLHTQGTSKMGDGNPASVLKLMKQEGLLEFDSNGMRVIHDLEGYIGLVFIDAVAKPVIEYFKALELKIDDRPVGLTPAKKKPRFKNKSVKATQKRVDSVVKAVEEKSEAATSAIEPSPCKDKDDGSVGVFINRNMGAPTKKTKPAKPANTKSRDRDLGSTSKSVVEHPHNPEAGAKRCSSAQYNTITDGELEARLIDRLVEQIKAGKGEWIGRVTSEGGALWVDLRCIDTLCATSIEVTGSKLWMIANKRKDLLLNKKTKKLGVIL